MSGDITTAQVTVDYSQPAPASPSQPPASPVPADGPDGLAWTGADMAAPVGWVPHSCSPAQCCC